MSTHRRRGTSSLGRLLWGGLALLLLVALIGSVLLSRKALKDQEAAAADRAAGYVNDVLFGSLTPYLMSAPILGPNYRELISAVQAGILSDDRVARIRIWKTDGALVFSSDQRDRIGEFVARDSPQIAAASEGQVVSLLTQANVALKSGLAGSDEELYETFVPLRLFNQLAVSGVVQIDQHYSAIQSAADRIWRPVQIGLAVALLVAIVLLLRSFRRPLAEPVGETAREVRAIGAPGWEADIPAKLRAAQARAEEAERAHREVQAKLDAELSAKATDAAAAGAPGVTLQRVAELAARLRDAEVELDAKLGAAEAEREHLVSEAQRLRAALSERDGELAIAREGATTGEAEAAKAAELTRSTEQRIAELEQRSQAAEQRALAAEQRVSEIEGELRTAASARESLEAAAKKTTTGNEAKAGAELRQAQLELNTLRSKLADAEGAVRDATSTTTQKDANVAELQSKHERASSDLDSVRSTLLKREKDLKALEERAAKAESSVAEITTARASLVKELEASRAVVAAAQAEKAAASAKAGSAEKSTALVAELEARVAELEERRRSEVSELQRAQEALANTQVEATQAAKRAKDAETRIRELEEAVRAAEERMPESIFPRDEDEVAQPSITSRLAALHREPAPQAEPAEDETPVAGSDEGLSLRERLARAAAARHRPSGSGDG